MSRKTPSTKNVRNQVAIDAMIEGYQLATVLKEPELIENGVQQCDQRAEGTRTIYLNIRGSNSDPFH